MEQIYLAAPFSANDALALRAGQRVLLSGTVYTARDAAHKRLAELLKAGEAPPFSLEGTVIYYTGPTPAPEGKIFGSAGPTTSYRMDSYAPYLMQHGVRGMIGKGERSAEVVQAMRQHKAVYLAAVGGAGALLGQCVQESELVAYRELGAEAIYMLTVKNFPLVVAVDTLGNNLYESGPEDYLKSLG